MSWWFRQKKSVTNTFLDLGDDNHTTLLTLWLALKHCETHRVEFPNIDGPFTFCVTFPYGMRVKLGGKMYGGSAYGHVILRLPVYPTGGGPHKEVKLDE